MSLRESVRVVQHAQFTNTTRMETMERAEMWVCPSVCTGQSGCHANRADMWYFLRVERSIADNMYTRDAMRTTLFFVLLILCTTAAALFQAESDALRLLFDDMGGEHWINNTQWDNSTANYCSYFGITCDGEGHVTEIQLTYNNLTGQLPDLSDLSHLTVLDLGGGSGYFNTYLFDSTIFPPNYLTGPFPDWVTKTRLEYIDFYNHYFVGTLPDDLGNLVNLTYFSVGADRGGGLYGPVPDSWMKLIHLKVLGLWANSFTSINLTRLNDMVELEYIEIGHNNFGGNLSQMIGTLNLPKLIDFAMAGNKFYGPIPDLSRCTALQWILLDSNSFTGEFPEWTITLPDLFSLTMTNNLLTGTIPPSIGQMKSLFYFYVSGNNMNGELPDTWDQMTSLVDISVYANNFTGEIPPSIYRCTNLELLFMSNNRFTGVISPDIKSLKHMTFLVLGYNQFCEGGCLLDYLSTHGDDVTQEKKDGIILGIAKGVLHLHQEKIIHRDLAARNILLSKHLEAKVSDFGMSRQVQTKDSASTTASNIGPVKWMSPEAISKREYSTKSDAFSFGVVIWEILTCKEPWADVPMVEVAINVIGDQRLTIPADTTPTLQAIMKGVWMASPDDRPDFFQICNWLSDGAPIHTKAYDTEEMEERQLTNDGETRYGALSSVEEFLEQKSVE
ncbi:hypothetical protein PROFUN_03758 [Planoprotostelium fungivorum]|uniref:Protein kinase domain-containing protein n=1 Tax=Planoprotostelium fungivorum TaxID=1890364 RepID=A0A2P6NDN3_9EUKA|nr:hypothetical protein PROFUN_03758 [Planoprotostelium fungivorum]